MVNTKFFRYRQTKSGGSFDQNHQDGIGVSVVIEAVDHIHADARAEQIGIYFNGCETGVDCDCCGDRWSSQWDSEIDGYSVFANKEDVLAERAKGYDYGSFYIHNLDGTIDRPEAESKDI